MFWSGGGLHSLGLIIIDIFIIQHSTVIRNVFGVIKDGNEYQFLIDCQALNQIKSNLKSILLKLTPKPLIIFILVSNVLTYNI